jgi:uncharacterized protein YrrD
MDRFYTKIVGIPVVEDDRLRAITTVKDLIIDPESGKVLAFVVDSNKNLIVMPMDVISWHDVLHINHRDSIISGDDVLRIQAVQKEGTNIFGNKVETKNGKYLGKVVDYSIDNHSMILKRIFVAKGFLGLVRFESRVISSKSILEILPEKIIVKDDLGTVKADAKEKIPVGGVAAA